MFTVIRARLLPLFLPLALMVAPVGAAWSATVQPLVLNLQPKGRGMSQSLTVENTFSKALPVEMRVEDLGFDDKGVHGLGKDSGDLLVFPPQALIQPGQTQTFRVQYVGDPQFAKSKHYYVTVAQLPVVLPEGQSAIQILYDFQVMVSIAPDGAKPDLKITATSIGSNGQSEPVPIITLVNNSPAYGYLSAGKLRIIQQDASGKEIFRRVISGPEIQQTIGFGLVTSGQTRQIMVPVVLPSKGGSVAAEFIAERRR